jgi:hypothetical protein
MAATPVEQLEQAEPVAALALRDRGDRSIEPVENAGGLDR